MLKSLRYLFLLFAIFLFVPLSSFANFDFNANCLNAYKNIFELKLGNARAYLSTEKKLRPNNSIIPLLENYIDYFTLLTSDSKAEFDRLKANKSVRLNIISADDKTSPYYLYAQAEINLQWALIHGRYGEYFNAAMEIRKANSLLAENVKKFPSFPLSYKGLGLINAVLGSLPDGALKSTLATFGIKGDTEVGLAMLDKLAGSIAETTYEPFYEEVAFYYSYVLIDVAHSASAYTKTMHYTARMNDSSLLKTYLQGYVSIKYAHTDNAMAIFKHKPEGAIYVNFPYLDYLEGVAHLNKLDLNAVIYFENFLKTTKGVDHIKDTYMHLAWVSLLKGDKLNYKKFAEKAVSNGFLYQEKDKQAQNEALSPMPNVELLKARLLFDGGYLTKALSFLADKTNEDFATDKDKTEFNYRLGRIYDDLGKDNQSLTYYQNAINIGRNLKYYFAANAALQMGKVYEKKKDFIKAKSSYNTAINMKDHEYESSIETQAKAGLKRIAN